MDRLETMRVFVAVAEEQGFASAARRLGISPAAVTRAVATLEKRLGTGLLRRTTRVVRLTEAGARFVADCKRILNEIEEAEGSAAGSHAEPRGRLGVTAPMMFGRLYVAPIVLEFLLRYPHASVQTMFADRVVDLFDEGLDVAVRIAHLPDSSLTAIKVGSVRRVVCASPAYFAKRGEPRSASDLSAHEVIAFSQDAAQHEWSFGPPSAAQRVRLQPRLFVNTADAAIAAALAGRGLTRLLSYQIAQDVHAGRLRIVLTELEPPSIPVSVVFTEGRRVSARVRAFLDFAVAELKSKAEAW